ncbi:isoleucine--tRNA ligase [Striga asiatica]|uniref:Isoleucine--tRNA ligase n=1 Tax=Striga asiatica TaxID=4170 RepID=A0A5A7QWX7_STRAF|nr:isoleucine--tRNA ligase [Striga asiatica]
MEKELPPVVPDFRASAMGKNSEKFSLFFNYGGTFIKIGDSTEYFGENSNTDRFGYFDLVEEVEKLGVKEFDKIMYQDPEKLGYAGMKEIVDDSGVMEMIDTGHKLRFVIQVYVAAMGVSSSNDDLTDEEHASDDDEYLEARQNLRKCKNKMVEEDGGANNTFPDCLPQMDLDGCEKGHNKKSCTNPQVEKPPKNPRGRLKKNPGPQSTQEKVVEVGNQNVVATTQRRKKLHVDLKVIKAFNKN